MLTIAEWPIDMSTTRATHIKQLLNDAINDINKREKKAVADAYRSIRSEYKGPDRISVATKQEEIPQIVGAFAERFKHDVLSKSRRVRNRHVLLRVNVVLPSEEAKLALADDPGLVTVSSADLFDDRAILLVRWDAACAYCGQVFELDCEGDPLQTDGEIDDHAKMARKFSRISLDEMLMSSPSGWAIKVNQPFGGTECPLCGWRADLSPIAKELLVEQTTHGIKVKPSLYFGSEIWEDNTSWSVVPDTYRLELNYASGKTMLLNRDITEKGLSVHDRIHLDEYPIARIALGVLFDSNKELANRLEAPNPSLNDVVAAIKQA